MPLTILRLSSFDDRKRPTLVMGLVPVLTHRFSLTHKNCVFSGVFVITQTADVCAHPFVCFISQPDKVLRSCSYLIYILLCCCAISLSLPA